MVICQRMECPGTTSVCACVQVQPRDSTRRSVVFLGFVPPLRVFGGKECVKVLLNRRYHWKYAAVTKPFLQSPFPPCRSDSFQAPPRPHTQSELLQNAVEHFNFCKLDIQIKPMNLIYNCVISLVWQKNKEKCSNSLAPYPWGRPRPPCWTPLSY